MGILTIKGKIKNAGLDKDGMYLVVGEHAGLFSTEGKIAIKLDKKAIFDLNKHTNLDEGEILRKLYGKKIEILIDE